MALFRPSGCTCPTLQNDAGPTRPKRQSMSFAVTALTLRQMEDLRARLCMGPEGVQGAVWIRHVYAVKTQGPHHPRPSAVDPSGQKMLQECSWDMAGLDSRRNAESRVQPPTFVKMSSAAALMRSSSAASRWSTCLVICAPGTVPMVAPMPLVECGREGGSCGQHACSCAVSSVWDGLCGMA